MMAIELTESAAYEVKDMLKQNDMPDGFLRFKVQGGGCTGLTYGMAAETEKQERDEEYEFHGVRVLVDKYDLPVIDGTVIGFKQSLMGGGFTIDNPKASLSCGCGSSFRTKEVAGQPEDC
nr:iron-sulfur cluster assembly accessory protein [Salinicoccus sediminis]